MYLLYGACKVRHRGYAGEEDKFILRHRAWRLWGKGDTEPVITRVKRTVAEKCRMMEGTKISPGASRANVAKGPPGHFPVLYSMEPFGIGWLL